MNSSIADRINILFFCDDGHCFKSVLDTLECLGFEVNWYRTSSLNELFIILDNKGIDLVISDYSVLENTALDALKVKNKLDSDIPFLVVTKDKIGEENVVKLMKNGCDDFILYNNIERLGKTIEFELIQADKKRQMKEYYEMLERERERLDVTLHSIGDGIIILDLNAKVKTINATAEELTGWKQHEAINKSLDQIFKIIDKKTGNIIDSPFRITIETGIKHGLKKDTILVSKTGEERFISASCSPIKEKNNNIIGVILVFRDVTRIRKTEEQLEMAKEAAEVASQAKSEFLANMSHEIRTPLNGIIGMIDLTFLTDLTPEQKENLSIVKKCVELLMNIINDILDISKIEAKKLTLSDTVFDIRELIREIINTNLFNAHEKNLELFYEIDENIPKNLFGDPYRLQQVLNNLIGNGLKFTEKGFVKLRVEQKEMVNNQITILFSIIDTGIGIAEDKMYKLFRSFSQVDGSITRKYGGAGLGLSISKKIIEMMDGKIWVESTVGKGSTFYFTAKFRIEDIKEQTVQEEENTYVSEDELKISDEMFAELIEQRKNILSEIKEAIELKDYNRIEIYSESLKNIATNVKNNELKRTAFKMVLSARKMEIIRLEKLFKSVIEQVKEEEQGGVV